MLNGPRAIGVTCGYGNGLTNLRLSQREGGGSCAVNGRTIGEPLVAQCTNAIRICNRADCIQGLTLGCETVNRQTACRRSIANNSDHDIVTGTCAGMIGSNDLDAGKTSKAIARGSKNMARRRINLNPRSKWVGVQCSPVRTCQTKCQYITVWKVHVVENWRTE